MKIAYITTDDPKAQGDYQENVILHGLRMILRDNCIDYPRKKTMYGEFDECKKSDIHGWGFSIFHRPIPDIASDARNNLEDIDFVIYGVTDAYGVPDYPEINKLAKYGVVYIDGHDHMRISKTPCFKREWSKEFIDGTDNVWPTGFGIPEHLVRPLDFEHKTQMIQITAPPYALFGPQILGMEARKLYRFDNEEDYYDDMASSWFGLTCMKGGWDSMRHYEIMAAGALLLFRDYDKKPDGCSPNDLPCFSYSSKTELNSLMKILVVDGKPTGKYKDMLQKQRNWLLENGTTKARAQSVLSTLSKIKRSKDEI